MATLWLEGLLAVLGTVIFLVSYFLQDIQATIRYFKMINKLPTAKGYTPFFGHALTLMGPRNRLEEKYRKVVKESEEDPCVVWFGPVAVLSVLDAQHSEIILGSSKYIDKPFFYRLLEPWLGTGLLTSTGSKWHSHRKMLTPTFHFKILENFVEVFTEKSLILVEKLEKEARAGKEFDIFPYIGRCALDVICDEVMHRVVSPWLYLDSVYKFTSRAKRVDNYIGILHGMTNKIIRERKEQYKQIKSHKGTPSQEDSALGRKKRLVFLDLLIENSETEMKLTDEEIREEVDTFMFEGHDTTSAAVGWGLQLLAMHPEIQEKVYEEQFSLFQGSEDVASMQDLNDMKYLERVIKETLRLYPSVPIFARELKEDVQMGKHIVPAGTRVVLTPYYTHRMEEHYPNPEVFDPDRFLPENVAKRHPYAYIPFSAGPRNCIGQKFAMLEMKSMFSSIIRHYKLETTREMPVVMPELIIRPENGVHLKITKRLPAA